MINYKSNAIYEYVDFSCLFPTSKQEVVLVSNLFSPNVNYVILLYLFLFISYHNELLSAFIITSMSCIHDTCLNVHYLMAHMIVH
jgi:hypothetical protein